jgi:hypothetical protein
VREIGFVPLVGVEVVDVDGDGDVPLDPHQIFARG